MNDRSQLPELPGVTHRWIEAFAGVDIHIAEAGPQDGPPIMLVHGFPQNWWEWKAHIGPLADAGFHVICPDLRGAGWSSAPADTYRKADMADDLAVVLSKLDVGPVALVAHDWGGPVATIMMLRYPEKVSSFFGINTIFPWMTLDGHLLKHTWRFWYQLAMLAPGLGPRVIGDPKGRYADMLVKWVGGGWEWPAEDRAVYLGRMQDPARALAGSRWYRTFQSREALEWLKGEYDGIRPQVPVRWLQGLDDPVITPNLLRDYAERIDDYEIEYLEGVGHWVAEQAPQAVTDWLLKHNER